MFPLIIRNWNVTPTPQQSQMQLRNPMTNTQAIGPQQNTTITSVHVKTLHFSGKFIGHWFLSPTSWPQPFSIPGAILGSSSLSVVCSKTSSLPLSPGELNQDKLDGTFLKLGAIISKSIVWPPFLQVPRMFFPKWSGFPLLFSLLNGRHPCPITVNPLYTNVEVQYN